MGDRLSFFFPGNGHAHKISIGLVKIFRDLEPVGNFTLACLYNAIFMKIILKEVSFFFHILQYYGII